MNSEGQGGRQQRLAIVIHSRSYAKGGVLRALMDGGFSVTEQPADQDALKLIAELTPDLVVVALDPDEAPSPLGVSLTASLRQLPVVAIVPDGAADVGRVLDEFALAFLRDGDVERAFGAQVRALERLEREVEPEEVSTSAAVGGLEVDFARMRASYRGTTLDLGPSGTSILGYLLRESGRIVSPTELLEMALRRSYSESDARLVARQYIRRIRRALEAAGGPPNLVVNVRGFGYMVEPTATRRSPGNGQARRGHGAASAF